jgi:hypothetical protein
MSVFKESFRNFNVMHVKCKNLNQYQGSASSFNWFSFRRERQWRGKKNKNKTKKTNKQSCHCVFYDLGLLSLSCLTLTDTTTR